MRNSLADVVTAALRVLDEQGLENCSMRRVAAELDVQPSALYHHVPNKQTLLALMADAIVAGVLTGEARAGLGGPEADHESSSGVDPGTDSAAVWVRVRFLCLALRAAMLRVRDGADVVATAAAFRLGSSAVESRLTELVGADGARTLLLFTFGHAQSTQTHRQAAALGALLETGASGSPEDDGAAVDTGVGSASDLDASYERGLDMIWVGLSVSVP